MLTSYGDSPMSALRNPFAYRKPITLDTLGDLFSHHRGITAGWCMEADEGDDGGDGDADKGKPWTPPTSQGELDRIIQDRLSRVQKQYGMTPDEARALKERSDALEFELSSDLDKATQKAADDAYKAAMSTAIPRLITAEFKAEAKGVLTSDQLEALLEDVDLTRYAGEDGEPDSKKIAAKIAKFAPVKGSGTSTPRPLGQGHQTPAQQSARDLGRAEAEKRFGKK